MKNLISPRRQFLKLAGTAAGGVMVGASARARSAIAFALCPASDFVSHPVADIADYTLRIAASPIEIAPNRIVSTVTYNGQFPGPLLRFKEGRPVTVEIYNDTDTPEQLHWHGQRVPVDVDGAAEEGTPFIPA